MADRTRGAVLALLLALLTSAMASDAAVDPMLSVDGQFRLQASPRLQPLEINRLHAWDLRLSRADGTPVQGASIVVDGGMPAHDHGLPTRPRVREATEAGHYVLEGMRFHMHGEWRLLLRVEAGSTRDEIEWVLHL